MYFFFFWFMIVVWVAMVYFTLDFKWRPLPLPQQWETYRFITQLSGVIYFAPLLIWLLLLMIFSWFLEQNWCTTIHRMFLEGFPLHFLKEKPSRYGRFAIGLVYILITHTLDWVIARTTYDYFAHWGKQIKQPGKQLAAAYYYIGTLHFFQAGILYAALQPVLPHPLLRLSLLIIYYAAYAQIRWQTLGQMGWETLGDQALHMQLIGSFWNPFLWLGIGWIGLLFTAKSEAHDLSFYFFLLFQSSAWVLIFSPFGTTQLRKIKKWCASLFKHEKKK